MEETPYDKLPESMRDGARLWIEEGIYPGDFLTAVIENNLMEAVNRADDKNVERLPTIVSWWYTYAPGLCWGSKEKAAKWQKRIHAQKKNPVPSL